MSNFSFNIPQIAVASGAGIFSLKTLLILINPYPNRGLLDLESGYELSTNLPRISEAVNCGNLFFIKAIADETVGTASDVPLLNSSPPSKEVTLISLPGATNSTFSPVLEKFAN
ncbi:hypothetical protein D3C75_371080 [compost metagenome]